jgi:hypothetical protein
MTEYRSRALSRCRERRSAELDERDDTLCGHLVQGASRRAMDWLDNASEATERNPPRPETTTGLQADLLPRRFHGCGVGFEQCYTAPETIG